MNASPIVPHDHRGTTYARSRIGAFQSTHPTIGADLSHNCITWPAVVNWPIGGWVFIADVVYGGTLLGGCDRFGVVREHHPDHPDLDGTISAWPWDSLRPGARSLGVDQIALGVPDALSDLCPALHEVFRPELGPHVAKAHHALVDAVLAACIEFWPKHAATIRGNAPE
ncbi:MAG: hypothetical protein KTR15_12515 [Phycisphaeraceae bacterium]|nr:hypothetical protein [Phycisphaeraceae bacterium]